MGRAAKQIGTNDQHDQAQAGKEISGRIVWLIVAPLAPGSYSGGELLVKASLS